MTMKFNTKKLRGRVLQLEIENVLLRNEVNILYNRTHELISAMQAEHMPVPALDRNAEPLSAERAETVVIVSAMHSALTLFAGIRDSIDNAANEIHTYTGESVDSVTQRLLQMNDIDWDSLIASIRACATILDE